MTYPNPWDFEEDPSIVYATDPNMCLAYFNKSWDRFAIENGAPDIVRNRYLGASILDAIPGVLRPFYEDGFSSVLRNREPWRHEYDCSSSDVFRRFSMRVLPLDPPYGILVVNACTELRPMEREEYDLPRLTYESNLGIVTMCAHCQRTMRLSPGESTWDWVPFFLSHRPQPCSHGLCPSCYRYYYAEFKQAQRFS